MLVVIRVDASRTMGCGHVMRSLTLARALRSVGAEVSFVMREHPGNLIDFVRGGGFPVAALALSPSEGGRRSERAYASWVGDSWQNDARDVAAAIRAQRTRPDWLVADHYGLDEAWHSELRREASRVLVIDDLADRRYDCDLLLDQNLVDDMQGRYEGKLPERCMSMLGPRYALLHPVYAELRERVGPREGTIRRILVFFGGGAGAADLSALALQAFMNLGRPDLEIDVVVGSQGEGTDAMRAVADRNANVRVHGPLPSLAPLMAQADLAIGAAGTASWERLSLGLPALLVSVAENQKALAKTLHRYGLATWLGERRDIDVAHLQKALGEHVGRGCDTEMSRAGLALVDGRGVMRLRTAMTLDSDTPLRIRQARTSDEELLLEWANDPEARHNSFSHTTITKDEHRHWFSSKLRDRENCLLLIAETTDGVPLGMVRFDREQDAWQINYSVAGLYRGKGIGRRMLHLGLQELTGTRGTLAVVGYVAPENLPSHRVFRRLGFVSVRDEHGTVEYRCQVGC